MQLSHRLRFAALAAMTVGVLTACTPNQIADWIEWHHQDPAAAEEFANRPEVQAALVGSQASPPQERHGGGVWDRVAWCESGGNWSINTGNGYSGGLQFLHSSWRAYGGREFAPLAHQATRSQQIEVAERILDDVGWKAWPACSRRLGLR
jgi:Transglycosylase-like domain